MKKRIILILSMFLLLPVLPIIGALKVKSVDSSAEKWRENAGRSAEAFATEAEAGAEAWARNTAAAADTFHQAVSAAGIKERFRKIGRAHV